MLFVSTINPPYRMATPGAGIAVHTYGDFLNFNPYIHAIVPDGCFPVDGGFQMAPCFAMKDLSDTLDWLAHLVTHVPGRYEQTIRYYGYYSNKSRGLWKKEEADDTMPAIVKNEMSSKWICTKI